MDLTPDRLRLAAGRYQAFFEELRGLFVEREDVLTQIGLALLAREHVLMTGPPGTAKSRVATATVGRIVDDETRQPSLYSRQFTESTVQTDLVGPIDFKTLIETGRTEHFTDEGMLGAVHAFLDEVFDGRDMLLRSALNVLHERELKQGTTTKRGQIECAVMTSNRYLSEILEGSRETLLAFVDRIAFVSFVPRGFASRDSLSAVLRTQVGGAARAPLSKLLTLQDLDLLQAATERVYVAEPICELLVTLLDRFEREIASTVRADPTFQPTRYLSTRTAVRLGNLLRAIAVHDWATGDHERILSVGRRDLHALRFSLVSVGPAPEQLVRLLESESDPRERHQLSILRMEREIFERCFAELPGGPEHVPLPADASRAVATSLAEGANFRGKTTEELLQIVSAPAVTDIQSALSVLSERLVLGGLYAHAEELAPRDAAQKLATLADQLEHSGTDRRPIAHWLRERALQLLRECVLLRFPAAGSGLEEALSEGVDAGAAAKRLLDELASFVRLEASLSGKRENLADRLDTDAHWQQALTRLENELVSLWSEGVRVAVAEPLSSAGNQDLAGIIAALDSSLERMTATERGFDELGGSGKRLRQRVVGPLLSPFVRAAFQRFDTSARARVVEDVAAAFATLEKAGLGAAISSSELLSWTAEALLRADPEPPIQAGDPGIDGYRALRAAEQRVPLAVTLVEICARALGDATDKTAPLELLNAVRERLAELTDEQRTRIVARDLARIARPVEFLERWWNAIDEGARGKTDPDATLREMVRSRFFHVTRDESALARFALDARLLVDVFPAADVTPLAQRIDELDRRSLARVEELLAKRSESRWGNLLSS